MWNSIFICLIFAISFLNAKDSRYLQLYDLDGDENLDSVKIEIKDRGKCFIKTWRTIVKSKRDTIFAYQDEKWDRSLIVEEQIPDKECAEYEKFAKDFYFDYLPKNLIRNPKSIRDGQPLYKLFKETIRRDCPRYLRDSVFLDSGAIQNVVAELERRNSKNELFSIWVMNSPEAEHFPVAYSKVLKKFVQILEW